MEWILYLLIGILVSYVHTKFLDVRTMLESTLIAIFWPGVLVLDVLVLIV